MDVMSREFAFYKVGESNFMIYMNWKFFREIGCGGIDQIDLVQNRDQWRARVNMVTNLMVP
jgi:hypothetical protein